MKFHWNSHHFSLLAHIQYTRLLFLSLRFPFFPHSIQLQTNRSKFRHIYRINKKLRLHPRDWLRECNFRPTKHTHTHVKKRAGDRQRERGANLFDFIRIGIFHEFSMNENSFGNDEFMCGFQCEKTSRKNNNRLAVWQMNQTEFISTFVPFSVELQQLDIARKFQLQSRIFMDTILPFFSLLVFFLLWPIFHCVCMAIVWWTASISCWSII